MLHLRFASAARRLSATGLCALALSAIANAQTPSRFPQAPGVVAIENVTVIPMDTEHRIERQTVLVRDGRIAEVGAAGRVRVPSGATRIDGAGKFLIPGIAEMHGHIPAQPEFGERVLRLFLANGVTTVRGMLGAPIHLDFRARIARGELAGPVLWLAGPAMSGQIASADSGRARVERYHQQGFDLLKLHEGLSLEVYDTITATARRLGMPYGGHVSDNVGLPHALAAGQATVDHLDNFVAALQGSEFAGVPQWQTLSEPQRIDAIARATKAAGAAVVPTMVLWELLVAGGDSLMLGARPENRYMPPAMVQQWKEVATRNLGNRNADAERSLQLRKDVLVALRRHDVPILMGTDAPQLFSVPGYSLHRELEFMAALGFTPYELLATGTTRVAEHFGMKGDFGVVKAGARANLVLLDADPLADIGNLRRVNGVLLGGRWYSSAELLAGL